MNERRGCKAYVKEMEQFIERRRRLSETFPSCGEPLFQFFVGRGRHREAGIRSFYAKAKAKHKAQSKSKSRNECPVNPRPAKTKNRYMVSLIIVRK